MSAEFDATKRAFVSELARRGVDITYSSVTRQCLPGPIDQQRVAQLSQIEEMLGTAADMLTEDFTALGIPVINDDRYPVTLSGKSLVIATADTDAQDPCVHFILRAAQ